MGEDYVDSAAELKRLYDAQQAIMATIGRLTAEQLYYEGNEVGSWLELFYWQEFLDNWGRRYKVQVDVY